MVYLKYRSLEELDCWSAWTGDERLKHMAEEFYWHRFSPKPPKGAFPKFLAWMSDSCPRQEAADQNMAPRRLVYGDFMRVDRHGR
jgi:hypothetical protein